MKRTTEEIEKVAAELIDFSQADTLELLHIFETKYGLVPVVAAIPAQKTEESSKEEVTVEKTSFNVSIANRLEGGEKLQAIKALNNLLNIGLKPSQALITGELPSLIKENCTKSEAESIKTALEVFGAQIILD